VAHRFLDDLWVDPSGERDRRSGGRSSLLL